MLGKYLKIRRRLAISLKSNDGQQNKGSNPFVGSFQDPLGRDIMEILKLKMNITMNGIWFDHFGAGKSTKIVCIRRR